MNMSDLRTVDVLILTMKDASPIASLFYALQYLPLVLLEENWKLFSWILNSQPSLDGIQDLKNCPHELIILSFSELVV